MRVAIVGSGISACACAVRLKEMGIPFTVLERMGSPGGKLLTETIDGFTIEAGPDSFLPEKPWTLELIKKIGIEDDLLCTQEEHKGTYIYSGGRLHRLPEGVMLMVPTMITPLLRSRLITLRGKMRMGMEFFLPPRQDEADESLAQFVTRRLGRECLEKIAEPLVAGIHTSNPDNMSVRAIFPRFLDMEKKYGSLIRGMVRTMKRAKPTGDGEKKMTYFMSLKRGMQELVDSSLAFAGPENIAFSSEVRRVARGRAGYDVSIGPESMAFDAVVLTTPSYVTAELIRDMAPSLAVKLSAVEWSSTATISLAFKGEDILSTLPGFGFIVPRIEGRRINAATWSSLKWPLRAPPGSVLVRCFVGGGHDEELVSYPDEDLLPIVLAELKEIAGIAARPAFSKIYRWERSMPRYTVGHLERIAAMDEALKAHPGLYLIGSSYRGIGIGDCVRSGFEAAEGIVRSFRP